jgi:hypothetical protein
MEDYWHPRTDPAAEAALVMTNINGRQNAYPGYTAASDCASLSSLSTGYGGFSFGGVMPSFL